MSMISFYTLFIMASVVTAEENITTAMPATSRSREMDGYPLGYLSDCPGSTKPATIQRKSLKYLTFTVLGDGDLISARRAKYTYFQMRELAKDRDLDFKNKKTVVYVVGYLDSPGIPVCWPIGKLYKDLGYNVLLLDTKKFTDFEYPRASRYMRAAGFRAAEMLANLTKYGLDIRNVSSVGLSLGAHTMGFMAKSFQALTGKNISMLTGLDPAGPCFRHLDPKDRLDKGDADFVEMIVTNMDFYGMAAPVGHVNFYVNGGEYQPGPIVFIPCSGLCSHIRSYTVWLAAMLYPDKFIGIQCDSVQQAREKNCYDRVPQVTNVAGLMTDRTKPGIYFLATYNLFPYFLGNKGIKKENDFITNVLVDYNKEDVITL